VNSRFLKASKALRGRLTDKPKRRAQARKRQHRLLFESLEDRRLLAASPPLLSSVEGFNIDDTAYDNNNLVQPIEPAAPFGAVGPNHLLNVGNQTIQWFAKPTATSPVAVQQMQTSLKNFFAPLRPDYSVSEPKAIYDQFANRYVVVASEWYDVANAGDLFNMSRIMVAVSDDNDPNGSWYYHSINTMVNVPDITTPGAFLLSGARDPGFALDEEAIYLTGNLFEFADDTIPHGNRLWIIDKGLGKGGVYDPAGVASVKRYDPSTLTGIDFSGNSTVDQDFRHMQPAHVYGTAPAGVGTWLVLYDGLNNGLEEFVDVIRINNPLNNPTFTRFTLNVGDIDNTTSPIIPIEGLATQRGSADTLDFGDRRTVSAVWRNNALYATTVIYPAQADDPLDSSQSDDVNQVTAHWFKFDTTNAPALTLADQGSIGGEELGFAVHTGWPSVNVDSQGNVAIGFAAAGPNLYAGAYYAVRAANDPAGQFRTAGTLAAGLDVYESAGLFWGDSSSIALDPTDGVTFWAYNQYALPEQGFGGRWGTRWGSFRLGDAVVTPPPGPVSVTGVVWHDLDENRRRDLTEAGLSGWLVYADLDGDGERDLGEPSVNTDSQGRYSIQNINVTGTTLTIREAVKPGWRQTFPGAPALAQVLTLTGGGTIADVNFGNSDNDGFDYGDAPAPYPTLKSANGPKHAILPGYGLGLQSLDGSTVIVDGEPDGLPDPAALGDDNANFDDENGVVFATGLAPGKTATVTVTVSLGTNTPGRLQGWIDFNRDGDWADVGEQVFTNLTLAAGTHVLTVNVPSTAVPGATFARFRYGPENNLSYVGPSSAGEVEDHRVIICNSDPNAVDDFATVERNSQGNIIRVLDNDAPSCGGVRISSVTIAPANGTAVVDNNGTPTDFTDDFIRYTPASGILGSVQFTYTIQDTVSGATDTATVFVNIIIEPAPLTAVDDSYLVPPPTVPLALQDVPGDPYLLNVLKNDYPTGAVTIPANGLDTAGTVGTVSLQFVTLNGQSVQMVRYTPQIGFSGTDQFSYTIRDSSGLTDTATVTVQVGSARTADDVVRFRLVTADMNGNPISSIGQGLQFQVLAYVQDMRNEVGYLPTPGLPPNDRGVFSAYMDLLYDSGLVSFAGPVTFSSDYSEGRFYEVPVAGLLDEVGAFQGTGSDNNFGNPYGPTERLLYRAVFTASALGTARFKSDPADVLPLHETAVNEPETSVGYTQIDFGATTINIIESPDLVQIRLQATDLQGNPLPNNQLAAGTQFFVKAWVDDIRTTLPPNQEGVFSAYLDINYNSTLATPVTLPTTVNPLGFDITAGALFGGPPQLKGINRSTVGIVDEVGTFQGASAVTFAGEQLLFQIRFVALGGGTGTLTFTAEPADDLPLNETTLIRPDPGISVPPAQIRYVSTPTIVVVGGSGEGEFTNPYNRYDVNNDGFVTPIDVLALINFLNTAGTTDLTPWAPGGEGEARGPYYDVNSDYFISPIDVLSVVNFLNNSAVQSSGEGESAGDGLLVLGPLAAGNAASSGLVWEPDQTSDSRGGLVVGPRNGSDTSWWVPDEDEDADYFADVSRNANGSGLDSSLEGVLDEGLADDIAAAWALGSEADNLLADLV
jgi:hypothetical protein